MTATLTAQWDALVLAMKGKLYLTTIKVEGTGYGSLAYIVHIK